MVAEQPWWTHIVVISVVCNLEHDYQAIFDRKETDYSKIIYHVFKFSRPYFSFQNIFLAKFVSPLVHFNSSKNKLSSIASTILAKRIRCLISGISQTFLQVKNSRFFYFRWSNCTHLMHYRMKKRMIAIQVKGQY